jgi:hypothetical protein
MTRAEYLTMPTLYFTFSKVVYLSTCTCLNYTTDASRSIKTKLQSRLKNSFKRQKVLFLAFDEIP